MILFVARNVSTTLWYGAASLDWTGAMTELPYWTRALAVSQLESLQQSNPGARVISDASSDASVDVLVRFEAGALRRHPLLFYSSELHYDPDIPGSVIEGVWALPLRNRDFRLTVAQEERQRNRMYGHKLQVLERSRLATRPYDTFLLDPRLEQAEAEPRATLLLRSFKADLLNNWQHPGELAPTFLLKPIASYRNFLIWLPSTRSHSELTVPPRLEGDPLKSNTYIEGIARHMLFNVVNPSKKVRLVLAYTATLQGDGRNIIPPASALGRNSVSFDLVGRGSAHVFSPIITPQLLDHLAFLELDMGRDGTGFPDPRGGILALYGKNYPIDRRRLVGFIRDISIVSDADYRARIVPHTLSDIARQLADPGLEYSGLYEDGWTSEAFQVRLAADDAATLHVSGFIPLIRDPQFTTRAQVSVDGIRVANQLLRVGNFDITIDKRFTRGVHRIQVNFDRLQHFPSSDRRPVVAHLSSIGFDARPASIHK